MFMPQRKLIINPDGPDPRTIALDCRRFRIGRNSDADISIDDIHLSGLHCSLEIDEKGARLLDCDSTNGTLVNGKAVKKRALRDGDVISIGNTKIIYKEDKPGLRERKTEMFRLPDDTDRTAAIVDELKKNGVPADRADTLVSELELYRRNSRLLETLYALLERVLLLSDRNEAFSLVLKELRDLLGLEISSIFLVEENKFCILENDSIELSDEYPVVSRSVLQNVLASKGPVVIEEVEAGNESMKTLLRFKIRSALCFPVINRSDQVLGAVYCVSRQTGSLHLLKNDTHFIKACSAFLALVLENLAVIDREKGEAYSRAKILEQRRFTPIINRLKQEKENLALKLGTSSSDVVFFGLDHDDYHAIKQFLTKAAPVDLPILITGETGVGKSRFARAIHDAAKPLAPFVVIDCTTIPRELLESELFGHEKGAFTGAHARKSGKVSGAGGGTLFIDEIGELDNTLQAKLLRFIQTKDYEPLGGSNTLHSNARLIVATNRDLKSDVVEKRFREDLYYRLNVLAVELPPLRRRPLLIERFADHFLKQYRAKLNPKVTGFTDSARQLFKAYPWPGNIRELENTIMRGLINSTGDRIDALHCDLAGHDTALQAVEDARRSPEIEDPMDLKSARERIDRILIAKALDSTGGNVSKAADLLKISRNSLMDLIKKYGL
jgi:transcriptional regulator with GAF, ATPase, and Fis domain